MKFTLPQNPIRRFFLDMIFILLVFSLMRMFIAYFSGESIDEMNESLLKNWQFDLGFVIFLAGLRAYKRRQNLPSHPAE